MKQQKTRSTKKPKAIDRTQNKAGKKLPNILPQTPKQEELMRSFQENILTIAAGPAGSGKAQPMYSKILTPTGWVSMGSLKVGDTVRSTDAWTKVTGVFPQGNKKIYRITMKDGGIVDSCEDHLWAVYDSIKKEQAVFCTLTTKELSEKIKNKKSGRNIALPIISPIEYEEKELNIDPYLLGVLIGDGSVRTSTPHVTSADEEIFNNIKEPLSKLGMHLNKTTNNITRSLVNDVKSWTSPNKLTIKLKQEGLHGKLSFDKFIPEKYKYASINQRYSLLQGLMDTDGTVSKNGATSFCTTSPQLAKDVREIILSLGGKCTIKDAKKYFTYRGVKKEGSVAYILHMNVIDKTKLFRLQRKLQRVSKTDINQMRRIVKKVEYIGEEVCQCISVEHPSHLYVTDDYILTHNTFLAMYHAAKELFTGRTKQIILIRAYQPLAGRSIGFLPGELEDKLLPYYAQMLSYLEDILGKAEVEIYRKSKTIEICSLETIRGRSWDYATIIVDEAQNLYPEEIRALTTRIGEGSQLLLLGDDSGAQTDIRNKTNGLDYLLGVVQEYQIPDVGVVLLGYDDILRSDITRHFVIAFDKELQKDKNKGEKIGAK